MDQSQGSGGEVVQFAMLSEHVALATLNRPHKLNAIDSAVSASLHAIVQRTEDDPAVRVVLLAASGTRAFSAGADLTAFDPKAVAESVARMASIGGFAGFVDAPRKKIWIAVVEGLAVGGGCEICLACDMIVASDNASFGLPEVKRSFVAGAGGVFRLPRIVPRNVALEMIATGDRISAARAYALGMINDLTRPGEALTAGQALAERISVNAPIAVQESVAAARTTYGASEEDAIAIMRKASQRVRETEDYREGPRSFLEKRAPQWKGR